MFVGSSTGQWDTILLFSMVRLVGCSRWRPRAYTDCIVLSRSCTVEMLEVWWRRPASPPSTEDTMTRLRRLRPPGRMLCRI